MTRGPDEKPPEIEGPRIPVIYIVGAGRSGSTLLDRLIGQSKGVCSVGELQAIWRDGLGANQLCGCGKPFRSCDFWSAVIKRAFGDKGLDSRQTEAIVKLMRSVTRLRYIPYLESKRRPHRYEQRLREYGLVLSSLYQAIQAESGCQIIVDSSKSPSHGFLLKNLEIIDLRVLHLVRDSRAVAYSWKRVRQKPEIHWMEAEMQRLHSLKSAAEWCISNTGAYALRRRSRVGVQVKYETLATSPEETISSALTSLAPELFEDRVTVPSSFSGMELAATHSVSGNPMRFQSGPLHIQEDIKWKSQMGAYDRYMVTIATLPRLKAFGYPLRTT